MSGNYQDQSLIIYFLKLQEYWPMYFLDISTDLFRLYSIKGKSTWLLFENITNIHWFSSCARFSSNQKEKFKVSIILYHINKIFG